MSQLSFSFQNHNKKNLFTEEDFVLLPENIAAFNFLKSFFAQNNFAKSQFTSMILKGEKASGKTHLLNIFAIKFEAEFLNEEKISNINLVNFFSPNKFYIFEDIEKIQDEELLLHLINSVAEAKAFLILTSQNNIKFKLKDLLSRLNNIASIQIKNPSLESIKQLLSNQFSRRQIKLSQPIINFTAENITRSYQAILDAIKVVEFHVQEQRKNLNMKEIKTLLITK